MNQTQPPKQRIPSQILLNLPHPHTHHR
ncbi:hypothetical protein TGAM01_v201069 [Trichoderma gamsii]|uniref:Uncharacterized protein n=1 Tax=Trichoderma gamsii TaxID=398673 RepID=A0A2P4ZZL3_9HYPO|nr:hypothetical protein TGAM01_v201069 [Trichoderma gamsii]